MSNMSLKSWIENFDNGDFTNNDRKTQCNAGWYDWFCKDSSLRNKTYKMAPMVKRIACSDKINQETMYVFFKNNCPMYGSLYDDFRICDLATGEVLYTIVPSYGLQYEKGTANVYGPENDFQTPLATGKMRDIYKYFGV
jgi:hypothetical protein